MEGQSSSSVASRQKRLELPLISCTFCKRCTILELEVQTDEKGNRGHIFYKCRNHKVSLISFCTMVGIEMMLGGGLCDLLGYPEREDGHRGASER
uniref:Zinc finger GRF-type domain-containing protein n=1 Tax=Setaria viridis TaxID=4556 RepID=A0A4U6T4A6_SETVI|nr:hypothetical protein SEVIR_9G431150v2 [Setaria viridis]